jgi:hypothetical protein
VVLTNTLVGLLHYYIPWISPEAERRRRDASASPRRHRTTRQQQLHPHGVEYTAAWPQYHIKDTAGGDLWSGSESDREEEEEEQQQQYPISGPSRYRMTYPSTTPRGVAVARGPRRRGPPPGVRIAPTIPEESSG